MCLFVVTGEGFHCLQPGCGACLCKIEAFFLLGERKGAKGGGEMEGGGEREGGQDGEKKWAGGRVLQKRDPQRCA